MLHASLNRLVSAAYDAVVLPSAAELKSPTAITVPRARAGPARNSAAWASCTAGKSSVSRWVLTKRNR